MSTKKNARSSLVTKDQVRAIEKILTELQCILRWSQYIADFRYNELNKQGLNSIIAYLIAAECENAGKNVDKPKLVKVILYRMVEKLNLCDIRRKLMLEFLNAGGIELSEFEALTKQRIESEMGREFSGFIEIDETSFETRLFQGATKIATRIELRELRTLIPEDDYFENRAEMREVLNGFSDIPEFARFSSRDSEEMKFFKKASSIRNRIRWQKYLGTVKCSVLGHCFETAVLSYLKTLEEYRDEERAAHKFFVGLFHDLGEAWIGDVPGPIKKAIRALRNGAKVVERRKILENVYKKLPDHLAKAIQDVMEEDKTVKMADNMSACGEILRNIVAGSKDKEFIKAINATKVSIDGAFREALEDMIKDESF